MGTAFPYKRVISPHLGLDVIPCHDVANCSQSWGGHFVVIVPAGKMVHGQNPNLSDHMHLDIHEILSPVSHLHYLL